MGALETVGLDDGVHGAGRRFRDAFKSAGADTMDFVGRFQQYYTF